MCVSPVLDLDGSGRQLFLYFSSLEGHPTRQAIWGLLIDYESDVDQQRRGCFEANSRRLVMVGELSSEYDGPGGLPYQTGNPGLGHRFARCKRLSNSP